MNDGDLIQLVTTMVRSSTFWIMVLAALVMYLCLSVGLRWQARLLRQKDFSGTAFDASTIAPRVERVRQNHVAAFHSRRHYLHPPKLVAAARRMIKSFS